MILAQKSDTFGAMASSLCLVHCLITPLLFVSQTCSITCCSDAPSWWRAIDYIFIIVAFFAVYWSTRTTSKNWIRFALWVSWFGLLIMTLNATFEWFIVPKECVYIPALGLILLHVYNKKYCQCAGTTCCSSSQN